MATLVTRSSMPDFEEYCNEIREIWDSHWLTNMGVKHQAFQKQLEETLGVPHVTLYTNGHLALEGALAGMELPAGGEVITSPFTFVSTTNAIVRNRLKPVFCDIDPETYTIDPNKIEELITDKTVAILPIHVYGNICDVEAIREIADRHSLKVIYDAAHAFYVKKDGKSVASFGDVSMFSFHATKVFNTIEGGCLCYHQDDLVQVFNDIKNFGIHSEDDCLYIGGNAKMNEFQAAMGICNLRHLEEEIEKRRKVTERYRARLDGIDGIRLCRPQNGVESNYAYFPAFFDPEVFGANRDKVKENLAEHDIFARKYFYPLTSEMTSYHDFSKGNTPIARRISENILTLPIFADLPLEEVDRICDVVINTGRKQ